MTAKDYILTKLQSMANLFPALTFRYEHKEKYETHVVEVMPEFEFAKNEDYIDAEIDLSTEFNEVFYPESILFISENSLSSISNVHKVFSCNQFEVEKNNVKRIPLKFEFDDCLDFNNPNQYALAA